MVFLRSSPPASLLEILERFYTLKYSRQSARILIKSVRTSTSRQYQSVWSTFCEFVRSRDIRSIDNETILSFFSFLFEEKKLMSATISAYRSALAKPLRLIFEIDMSQHPFVEYIRALFNIRPSLPSLNISWSLDKVLSLAMSRRFQDSPSMEDLHMRTLFLLALATGNRVSELGAILRSEEYCCFSEEGVVLFPNPNFLAKNECPQARRDSIRIPRLKDDAGSHHPLCPVHALELYLVATRGTPSLKVFVDPRNLSEISVQKIRLWMCKFIRMGDSGAFPKAHDLRKLATSFAFMKTMSGEEVCSVVGWSSIKVFKRHYLKRTQRVSSQFISLGSRISS